MMADAQTRRARPVIAIDGPAGAGKSTVARALARALDFTYLNTGAMYRAVAVAAHEAGIDSGAGGEEVLDAALRPLLDRIAITLRDDRVMLDGRDRSDAIARPEIGEAASRLSTLPSVRARLRELQRAAGAAGGIVMEGRDIGTAIFPDAECKFFLVASPAVRAARRHAELMARGVAVTLAAVAAELEVRDRRDRERQLAPLVRAPDAMQIDTSNQTVASIVAVMKSHVEAASRALRDLKRD